MDLRNSKLARRAIVTVIIIVVAAAWFIRRAKTGHHYITATVTRGPIVRAVIATGTVNPVTTVQVGSYVSGPIEAIYADFNAAVKAGQLIAKIDPRLFQVKVDAARAALASARAQLAKDSADLEYKQLTLARNQSLFKADAISRDTLDNANSAWLQARAQTALSRANVQQQQANVKDAEVNLGYTNIISPVDGTIVSRNVDVGQTVAASFQTPTLFLIAKDLTQMQVDSNVSESDIGQVRSGQTAAFTVDAFPGREFDGTVAQVRQAPITVQNVVTYDVVVAAANPELLLKPGMTANVTIVTARRDDAVRIPVQALRFSPKTDAAARSGPAADSQHARRARVWIEADGTLQPVFLKTGLDDGDNAELLDGDLKPGDTVVTDELRAIAPGAGAPLSSQPPRFMR
jgi:HlyD family secretion protein